LLSAGGWGSGRRCLLGPSLCVSCCPLARSPSAPSALLACPCLVRLACLRLVSCPLSLAAASCQCIRAPLAGVCCFPGSASPEQPASCPRLPFPVGPCLGVGGLVRAWWWVELVWWSVAGGVQLARGTGCSLVRLLLVGSVSLL
jgi:hypothetical protein